MHFGKKDMTSCAFWKDMASGAFWKKDMISCAFGEKI